MTQFNPPEDTGYMGDRRRGASLGRPNCAEYRDRNGDWVAITVNENAAPFRLVRVRMCGDYDSGGAYWGSGGPPLYYFEGPLSDINGYVRENTRDAAKAAVRALHPLAKFYR